MNYSSKNNFYNSKTSTYYLYLFNKVYIFCILFHRIYYIFYFYIIIIIIVLFYFIYIYLYISLSFFTLCHSCNINIYVFATFPVYPKLCQFLQIFLFQLVFDTFGTFERY